MPPDSPPRSGFHRAGTQKGLHVWLHALLLLKFFIRFE